MTKSRIMRSMRASPVQLSSSTEVKSSVFKSDSEMMAPLAMTSAPHVVLHAKAAVSLRESDQLLNGDVEEGGGFPW